MACENVAPIDLVSGKSTPCSTLCKLTYDYGNSDCLITNKENYLDIQCFDGKNEVKLPGYDGLSVTSVRLYNGSLNLYEGEKMKGELIIQHSSGSSNVFVCIPFECKYRFNSLTDHDAASLVLIRDSVCNDNDD